MKVDIDYIFWLYNELRKIEEVPLSDLEFYIENQKIEMDEEQIKRWAFTDNE